MWVCYKKHWISNKCLPILKMRDEFIAEKAGCSLSA